METINLGVDDGLPPVDWNSVAEKLDTGSAPAARRDQLAHDVAVHAQPERQPARHRRRRALGRRSVVVPDRSGHPQGPQRRS